MSEKFLYEKFEGDFARDALAAVAVPQHITANLKHRMRDYQNEAFQRFILWREKYAKHSPPHLLFNMATGSGKTDITAGLILHLFAQGYRNFLFFVHSNTIIQKTRDNFLAADTAKYLFADGINIDGRAVTVQAVENFADARDDCISIKFTTIQKLHSDTTTAKENTVSLEDLGAHKLIMLGDEAHHYNVGTATQQSLLANWETTTQKILAANAANMLLEFTATVDYTKPVIVEKYRDKILYKYDLRQFRADGYSKEINLFKSQADRKQRMLLAVVLNMYRREIAATNGVNCKPVILFKSHKISESEDNKEKFHRLIDNLSPATVAAVRDADVGIVKRAFAFFAKIKLTDAELARRIKLSFARENCLSANNESEKEANQIRLNTLEDDDNPICAVFAVQKLNEGWDVLNLFDIVRLYETRDAKNNKPGNTTIAEAQLIGRGARYFPFQVAAGEDKFTRKYDRDTENDLKILEELYYHAHNDSQYISEIKQALVESGIYDGKDSVEVQISLKADFKNTELYQHGSVFVNEKSFSGKAEVNRAARRGLGDLRAAKVAYKYKLSSLAGEVARAFEVLAAQDKTVETKTERVAVKNIPPHVQRAALAANEFYWFDNLQKWFGVNSISEFISGENYLGGLEIEFSAPRARLKNIANRDYYFALREYLTELENDLRNNTDEFEVSDWIPKPVNKVFNNKKFRVREEYAKGQRIAEEAGWYAYSNNYGTPEETGFVEMFERYFQRINKKYKDIYLLRNERQLKIYDREGRRFEPDFVLFCDPKTDRAETYQIFIEPKGEGFAEKDRWKEDFLTSLNAAPETIKIKMGEFRILGLPFYNNENPEFRAFEKAFTEMLGLETRQSHIAKN